MTPTDTGKRSGPPPTRVWTDVSFEEEGRSCGFIRVPHSTHQSAYGWIPLPLTVLKNGQGPRVLLMAGNHGDEYEGQIILMKLIRTLALEDVRGQIIIISAANAPAVKAGLRVSPIDGGNLNRLFPGDPNGPPTAMIAHFLETEILPRVEFAFDFHSGGCSLDYLPCAHLVGSDDAERMREALGFLEAFAMPYSIVIGGLTNADQRFLGACARQGVRHMSTELGGGGRVSIAALREAEQGLYRLLHHVGTLRRPLAAEAGRRSRLLKRLPTRSYIHATEPGIFEPFVDIGDEVEKGQTAGAIHFPATPWREPAVIAFSDTGIVLSRRVPAPTEIGDCLFNLGVPWEADASGR